jgi:very-short-patch-repair endonuclease
MPKARSIHRNSSGQANARSLDGPIAELAGRQHGIVSRRQLLDAGFDEDAIDHKLKTARLHMVHRGVYAVGHRALTREARWMAATFAAGPGGALSHRAAATLQLIGNFTQIEVTAPTQRQRPRIRIYRSSLPPDEITVERNIPVTTIPRTLLDLAAVLPAHQVERAANEAQYQGHRDRLSLADMVARYPRRKGIRTIKQILARLERGTNISRSDLEALFIAFLRDTGLPLPSQNYWLQLETGQWIECDCIWLEHHLIAELDGRSHGTPAAFEDDRSRDRALVAVGWRTIRVTWNHLHGERERLAADLRRLLSPS